MPTAQVAAAEGGLSMPAESATSEPSPRSDEEPEDWFSQPRFGKKLKAYVVDAGRPDPTIHGFAVCQDLARNFSFGDAALLSLTGEEPAPAASQLFNQLLVLLMPLGIAAAPTHSGALAHQFSGDFASSLASAWVVATERARSVVQAREPLLRFLRSARSIPAPAGIQSLETETALHAQRSLEGQCEAASEPWFQDLDQTSALLAALFECGLTEAWQWESALCLAWSPCVMAEIAAHGKQPLESYPINLPRYDYEP